MAIAIVVQEVSRGNGELHVNAQLNMEPMGQATAKEADLANKIVEGFKASMTAEAKHTKRTELVERRPAPAPARIHIREVEQPTRTLCGAAVVAGMRLAPVSGCDEGATCEGCLEKF